MKKIMVLILGMIIVFSQVHAQTSANVPEKVKTAFAEKFPGAKDVIWDKEDDAEWEAEFSLNDKEYSANFSVDGTWKETEYEISESELPAAVKERLKNDFADCDIEEIEISETADGKTYEFALEKDETDIEVAILPNGEVVKNEMMNDEDGDEEEDHEMDQNEDLDVD